MNKVLIVDDEPAARLLIKQYLSTYPELVLIAEAQNGFEAVELINKHEPEIVFLDIQMPGWDGFEVIKRVNQLPKIIFSTAYDNYALKAFDVHAIDYLLKPYTKERFAKSVSKIINSNYNNKNLIELAESLHSSKYPEKIFVEHGSRLVPLPIIKIIWIEASKDYTRLHTDDNVYLSTYGISEMDKKLNPSIFTRIHRSAIINVNEVKEISKDSNGYIVLLSNKIIQRVSRSYSHAVKQLIA